MGAGKLGIKVAVELKGKKYGHATGKIIAKTGNSMWTVEFPAPVPKTKISRPSNWLTIAEIPEATTRRQTLAQSILARTFFLQIRILHILFAF
jgi:hypothetical protein